MSEAYLGEIRLFAGNYAPQGWAICNGDLLAIASFEALHALLGKTYGGDGVTTFALPDYRGRIPVGIGSGGVDRYQLALGATGGVESVTLTAEQTPTHTHRFNVTSKAASEAQPTSGGHDAMLFGKFAAAGATSGLYSKGSGSNDKVKLSSRFLTPALGGNGGAANAHNNMMGSLAMMYIICLSGYFPVRP